MTGRTYSGCTATETGYNECIKLHLMPAGVVRSSRAGGEDSGNLFLRRLCFWPDRFLSSIWEEIHPKKVHPESVFSGIFVAVAVDFSNRAVDFPK